MTQTWFDPSLIMPDSILHEDSIDYAEVNTLNDATLSTGFSSGGGFDCTNSSVFLDSCLISSNAGNHAGAVEMRSGSSVSMTSCYVSGNIALQSAGGVRCVGSDFSATNCVFVGNRSLGTSGFAGGIQFLMNSVGTLLNCSFNGNSAGVSFSPSAGGISALSSPLVVTNSIFWDNHPRELFIGTTPQPSLLSHNDVKGGVPTDPWITASNNIDGNPVFVAEWDGNAADLRLQPISPCIDAGISSGAPTADIEGTPRPIGARVDLGAYEIGGVSSPSSVSDWSFYQ